MPMDEDAAAPPPKARAPRRDANKERIAFFDVALRTLGRTLSNNEFAALVGHGPYTIKRALGCTPQVPPLNQKVLCDMERFMHRMFDEQLKSLPARIALIDKKRKRAWSSDSDDDSPKRSRTTLSKIGQEFIDHYLETYITFSGDCRARARLYKEILDAAQTRKETLNSAKWTIKIVQKRLQNAYAKKNQTTI